MQPAPSLVSRGGASQQAPGPRAGSRQSTTEAVCTPMGDKKQHRNQDNRTNSHSTQGPTADVTAGYFRCVWKCFTTQMLFRGRFYKMPGPERIIVGLQKERKPGWLNISAVFEKKPQKPQQEQM